MCNGTYSDIGSAELVLKIQIS